VESLNELLAAALEILERMTEWVKSCLNLLREVNYELLSVVGLFEI
jgi:ABC-type enterochelin transport system permease subunit